MGKNANWLTYLCQKKMILILVLGFASGLPLGLTGTTLQAWYAMENVDIVTIGFLGLVGQPYVFKFLWSPLMDKFRLPIWGRRRGWILVSQIALIVTLCAIAKQNPAESPGLLALLALLLSFLSATQDIAIDAYRTDILSSQERGMGTAMAVSGYRIAMLVSGGLTLIMAHHVGFSETYFYMAALMGLGVIATYFCQEPPQYQHASPSFVAAFVEPFKDFLSRDKALWLLGFIVLYKLGDAFAGSLTSAFLLKGVGFSLSDVGYINKTVGLASTLLGIFCGGILMVRMGLYRSLLWFGIAQAATNLLFFFLAQTGPNYSLLIATVFLENFGGGLGTAAFMALVMSLCNKQFTATQFALLSSLSAVGRVFVGPLAGIMVSNLGWAEFYLWTIVIAVPGLLLLRYLRDVIAFYGEEKDALDEAITEAKAEA
jgi:PAT family beta-lactamase induction signal transducer AmpG